MKSQKFLKDYGIMKACNRYLSEESQKFLGTSENPNFNKRTVQNKSVPVGKNLRN